MPSLRILLGGPAGMGPGKAAILEAIDRTGSISAAAREMGMSYRKAWLMVDAMNHCFREPVVMGNAGGTKGGGAAVTEMGREVVRCYREMENKARTALETELAIFSKLIS